MLRSALLRLLACLLPLLLALAPAHAGDDAPDVAASVAAYFAAKTPAERAGLALALAARGASVEDVLAAVPAAVAASYPKGEDTGAGHVVGWKRESEPGQVHTVFARVPKDYDPARAWPVVVWLHGGVNRDQDGGGAPAANALGERADAQGFLVLAPSAHSGVTWWTPEGVALVRGALEDAKARWHVDANRVYVTGFSDGGSGCYHLLAHDPDPYAAFLPMMGHPAVTRLAGGPTYAANVASRPVFAVNGGKDPLYPAAMVEPLVEELKRAGCDLTWRVLPEAGHDMNAIGEVWNDLWDFAAKHPRQPARADVALARHDAHRGGRLDWVEIVRVDPEAAGDPELAVKELGLPRRLVLGVRLDLAFEGPGLRISTVEEGSGAAEGGLQPGDVITKLDETALGAREEAVAALRAALRATGKTTARTLALTVEREGETKTLTVTARVPDRARTPRPAALGYGRPAATLLAHRESRTHISIATRHVGALRLHLSQALVDLEQPLTVLVNGTVRFQGTVKPDVAYVLAEAFRTRGAQPVPIARLLIR